MSKGIYGNRRLTALWAIEPAKAKAEVRKALEATKTIGEAAKKLGIDRTTLTRWLRENPSLRRKKKAA